MINIKYLVVCFTLMFGSFQIHAGPTQRHLNEHPLEEIIETIAPEYEVDQSQLIDLANTVLKIAENETEETFFGYHGMSQNTRLFQDILNAVFEEVLQVTIPKDFYFLRIPGEAAWNFENGKATFLDYFNNKPIPKVCKDTMLFGFLFLVEKGTGQHIALTDLSPQEYEILWGFFQHHLDYLFWSDWASKAKKYAMPENYVWDIPLENTDLPALVDFIVEKSMKLNPKMDPEAIRKWFSSKFHGFNDIYYSCIMVYILELKLEDPSIAQAINNLDVKFDDTVSPQNAMLVSMNASVFGNFTDTGSFSAGIFFENESVLKGDAPLEKILTDFFKHIGLEPSLANLLWCEGQKILVDAGNHRGCLLQFFDESKAEGLKPFSLADSDMYVSFRHGIPVFDLVPSEYIQGQYFLKNGRKDLELRLVMNNKTNLNPYSSIRMVRHDGLTDLDPEKIPLKMKELLQNASRDEVKLQIYIETLEKLWEVSLKSGAGQEDRYILEN
jgi:hypothetical protein